MNERDPNRPAKLSGELARLLPLNPEPPPLRLAEGDSVKVGKGRIGLWLVVGEYESGKTPEEMVRDYDTLVLAEVYAVIAYYLRHRDAVRAYLKQREIEADALQAEIEATYPRITKAELLARQAAREKLNAPAGQ